MANLTQHQGSCHCGKVVFDVLMDPAKPVTMCNCSICERTGTMLAFVPATQFTLKSGEDVLTDYQFGRKALHHLFCKVCGIRSFVRGAMPDGTAICAVNVRCLENIDLASLQVNKFDGRSL